MLPHEDPPVLPETITVPEESRGMRLDRYLGEALRTFGISREKSRQAIEEGKILRNGSPVLQGKTPVRAGDRITLLLDEPRTRLLPEEGGIRILYRDAHIVVLDKPPHLTVHPAPGRTENTLAGRLLAHFPELAALDGLRPGIVHRLDKDTSGLIIAALTEKDRLALARSFAERAVRKEYLALVHGVPARAKGEIRAPLGRHPDNKTKMAVVPESSGGRDAHSEYRTLYADPAGRFSLLAVRIHTGRTHQIRVHMAHIGHPLWGDAVYGKAEKNGPKAPRQMLHAWKLAFPHPNPDGMPESFAGGGPGGQDEKTSARAKAGELFFTCPPPRDFQDFVLRLASPLTRLVITGSPGCGKSTLLRLLSERGVPTWSADACIKEAYAKNGDGAALIRARFGERFITEAGCVDTRELFAAMRADDAVRREVERLIHPLARHAQESFWQELETLPRGGDPFPLGAAEVPLYLETCRNEKKTGEQCIAEGKTKAAHTEQPLLAAVYCPFAARAARMREKRGWDDTLIASMEAWQWPEERKVRAADLVVDNSGDEALLAHRADALIRVLRGIARHRLLRLGKRLRALWTDRSPV